MKRYYNILLIAALLGFYTHTHAQVTIGEARPPSVFSVLELIVGGDYNRENVYAAADPRGFRLPQFTMAERDILTAQILALPLEQQILARGLRIFNLDGYEGRGCIDTWIDAAVGWISRCGDTPRPIIPTCYTDYYDIDVRNFTEITVRVTDYDGNPTDETRTLVFLNFNLGGTSDFSPRQQMAHQSRWKGEEHCPITDSGGNRSHLDATIYGGLLQWGRTTMAPALRCNYDFAPAAFLRGIYNIAYYNPIAHNQFVWETYEVLAAHNFDWITPQQNRLWGNGGVVNGVDTLPTRNDRFDPCPEGWRVPTQHEWAMLGTDRGGAAGTANDVISINIDGTGNASGLAWIPVANGRASTNWFNNQETNIQGEIGDFNFGSNNGIAIYYLSDWQNTALWTWTYTVTCPDTNEVTVRTHDGAALTFEERNLTHDFAPEPLMFLPAQGHRNAFAPDRPEVHNTGAMGQYWTSTTNGIFAYFMDFDMNGVTMSCNNPFRAGRAVGRAIRCIRGCIPISEAFIFTEVQTIVRNNPVSFTALHNVDASVDGRRFSWYLNDVLVHGPTNINGFTLTPAADNYKLRVRIINDCGDEESDVHHIAVVDFLQPVAVRGLTCLDMHLIGEPMDADVANRWDAGRNRPMQRLPLYTRPDDFADGFVFDYVFRSTNVVTNITFTYSMSAMGMVTNVETIAGAAPNEATARVTFNSNIRNWDEFNPTFTLTAHLTGYLPDGVTQAAFTYPVTIRVQDHACGCPVRVAGGYWQMLQCHNVGANVLENPFDLNPAGANNAANRRMRNRALMGAYFRWGAAEPIVDRNLNRMVLGTIARVHEAEWPELADPCPPGWRIAPLDKWEDIINNNARTRTNHFLTLGSYAALPAVGYFSGTTGVGTATTPIDVDGFHYWTATANNASGNYARNFFRHGATNPAVERWGNIQRNFQEQVRCVRDGAPYRVLEGRIPAANFPVAIPVSDYLEWSTRNVDLSQQVNNPAAGLYAGFAYHPNDPGMFFQWNRHYGWSSSRHNTDVYFQVTDTRWAYTPTQRWNPTLNDGAGAWEDRSAQANPWSNPSPSNAVSWRAEYDPCRLIPGGWRLPTRAEFEAILYAYQWLEPGLANAAGFGWQRMGAFGIDEPQIFIPAAGARSMNRGYLEGINLEGIGTQGNYWTSDAPASANAYLLRFTGATPQIQALNINRAFPVRCVREREIEIDD